MNSKEKISALAELLLEQLKHNLGRRQRLIFEIEGGIQAAQLAVNLAFEFKVEPGPLTKEALDTFDRSVRIWSKKYDIPN